MRLKIRTTKRNENLATKSQRMSEHQSSASFKTGSSPATFFCFNLDVVPSVSVSTTKTPEVARTASTSLSRRLPFLRSLTSHKHNQNNYALNKPEATEKLEFHLLSFHCQQSILNNFYHPHRLPSFSERFEM